MSKKKSNAVETSSVLSLGDIYERRMVSQRTRCKLAECAFDQNFREDHEGTEVMASIARVGLDPQKTMLFMEHPEPKLNLRPHLGLVKYCTTYYSNCS